MKRNSLTFEFSLLQALFWMNMLVHITFAATYMQSVGYTNTGAGFVLAIGNGLAILLGPKLTSMITRGKAKALTMVFLCLFMQLAGDIAVLAIGHKCIAFSFAYTLGIAFCFPLNSVELELYSTSINRSIHIDYGISRGFGSLAFFLLSLAMGFITSRFPIGTISVIALGLIALQVLANILFVVRLDAQKKESERQNLQAEEMPSLPLGKFFGKYRYFSIMLLGLVLSSVGFRIGSCFLINIVKNAGGDVSEFSVVTAFTTTMELPVIFLYSRLSRRVKNWIFLSISLLAYIFKSTLLAVAGTMAMVYVAQILQGASYAMHWAAIVPFTTQVIDPENNANAQSLAFSVNSVAMFVSGLIGGVLLDTFTVSQTMWISTGLCVAGALIAFPCIAKLGVQKK